MDKNIDMKNKLRILSPDSVRNITIKQAFEFLESSKQKGMVLGLSSMCELTEKLGNPQNKLKNIIHIAGTNGKGSVGAFIEAVLAEAGYTVGRYSSPAVLSYFEIFRKNCKNITEAEYCTCMEQIMAVKTDAQPTAFEIETALAFLYMADCDYCIIETGLGGREDATNVINIKKLAVLTPISLDHMHILGNSIAEITAEKCGIFNSLTSVISSKQVSEAEAVIRANAQELPLTFAQETSNVRAAENYQLFDCGEYKDIKISLLGAFQPENAATALTALQALGISEKHIRAGFKKTVWHGRFDMISKNPVIIADGAHNRSAFIQLKKTLVEYYPDRKFNFITGVLKDKEYTAAAEIFSPIADKVYTITPDNPRALTADDYAEEFKKHGINAVPTEISDISKVTDKNGINVIFGSLSFMDKVFEAVKVC